MLSDNEIIQKFYQQISYSNTCKMHEFDGFTMTSTAYILYMPCHWQYYEERKNKIIALAEKLGYAPGMIITGDPDSETIQKINCDKTLPEKMNFRGRKLDFKMEIHFIDPRAHIYLRRTTLWDGEAPYWA